MCCSQKGSLWSSRWISWTGEKQAFSNSTREGSSSTWKGINHHILWSWSSHCYRIPEWIIWFRVTCYIMSSYSRAVTAVTVSGLHDSLTRWLLGSLSDGRGDLTSGCRLTCSVGNWSVLVVLIRCFGLGATVTAWLYVAHLTDTQAACVTHQRRLSDVFLRRCLQEILELLLFLFFFPVEL